MSETSRIEPAEVVATVERYVDSELRDAEKYDNRSLLDESGIFALHSLAATIYALGFSDGEYAATERERRVHQRRAR